MVYYLHILNCYDDYFMGCNYMLDERKHYLTWYLKHLKTD